MRLAPTLLSARIRGRPTGIFDTTAKVGRGARITNLTGDRSSLRVGRFSRIDGEIVIYPGARVSIGDFCYLGAGSRLWAYDSVELGSYVIVAHNVSILDSTTHPLAFSERKRQIEEQLAGGQRGIYDLKPKAVRLEEGVWVCAGATVLRGVTIGREAIISAGAVVKRDVEPLTVYSG